MTGSVRFAQFAARLSGECVLMLGWRPDDFWQATPDEIAAIRSALHGSQASETLSRGDIDRLMEIDDGQ